MTILEVRNRIFDLIGIHLNCWRLFSFGGRLFWDNRTVAVCNIRNQETLYMRLLLKGGARKSKKHKEDSQFQQKRSSKTKTAEDRTCSNVAKRRRSAGFLKRPWETHTHNVHLETQTCANKKMKLLIMSRNLRPLVRHLLKVMSEALSEGIFQALQTVWIRCHRRRIWIFLRVKPIIRWLGMKHGKGTFIHLY